MTETRHPDEGRLRLGVSACLLGHEVRFDGGHKRNTFLTEMLAPFVEWIPVCPEEEAGFGTPREAMRLVQSKTGLRLVTVRTGRDVTAPLTTLAATRVPQLAALDLDGFVLKKDSPSCGLMRVKIYGEGGGATRTGRGLFAEALCGRLPFLPVEEEGRLSDPILREHFIERVYAYRRLRRLFDGRPRPGALVAFHARHKLQLLAHAPALYSELGRMVARAGTTSVEALADEYRRGFMSALSTAVSRGRHVNVLQHVAGYFRDVLTPAARQDLAAAIADYERGLVPLIVPARLLRHYAHLHHLQYLCDQVYLDPYPAELMLRNQV